MCLEHGPVAFRALRLVRGTAAASEYVPRLAEAAAEMPHVRDATNLLLDAIRASYGGRVGKATAMRVPAFAKAHKIYTGTISCFPLVDYGPAGTRVANTFLANPSRLTTYTSLMSRIVSDLVCYDVAYLRVTERTWDGYPMSAEHMPYDKVNVYTEGTDVLSEYELGTVTYQGTTIPGRDVIRFDGDGSGGWLTTGSDAITTAAALEAAVLRSAEVPSPSFILKNTGADLPSDQVDALLTSWEAARAARSTAYLNSTLEVGELKGWSPTELQLQEARNASAVAVSRVTNLDPVWLGAGIPGASLVYQNRTDLYRQLIDLSLQPVMRQISDRLSMVDVTPRGHLVRLDTDTFLKANTTDLAALAQALVPIGVITPEQAAALIDLPGGPR